MEGSESTLPSSLQLVSEVLKFFGFWHLDNPSKLTVIVYKSYMVILQIVCYVILFTAQIIYIIHVMNDLEKLSNAMFLPLTYAAQVFKMWNFFIKQQRLKKIIAFVNKHIFKPKNDKQIYLLNQRMETFKLTYIIFVLMALATISLWAIFPLLELNSDETKLPIEAWYPFDISMKPRYQIAYIHQIIAMIVNAVVNISLDCLPPGFMAFISVQLELLSDSLENIHQQVETNLKKEHNTPGISSRKRYKENQFSENNMNQEFYEEMNRVQINCVQHHINILRLSDEINSMFNFPTLGQLSISVFTICVTMFQLTLVSPMSIQFVSMVLYQGCMLIELFLFCWYGNEIFLKSARLLASVYQSDWTNCSMSYKRNALIIMIRMHKPMRMYAGNFFVLSLETFGKILRSSWSYFAVLQQVHSK